VLQTTAIFANVGKGIMAAQEDLQVCSQVACSTGWWHMTSLLPQQDAFVVEPQQSQHVGGMVVYCSVVGPPPRITLHTPANLTGMCRICQSAGSSGGVGCACGFTQK